MSRQNFLICCVLSCFCSQVLWAANLHSDVRDQVQSLAVHSEVFKHVGLSRVMHGQSPVPGMFEVWSVRAGGHA